MLIPLRYTFFNLIEPGLYIIKDLSNIKHLFARPARLFIYILNSVLLGCSLIDIKALLLKHMGLSILVCISKGLSE